MIGYIVENRNYWCSFLLQVPNFHDQNSMLHVIIVQKEGGLCRQY
jgi:hypothetical protein